MNIASIMSTTVAAIDADAPVRDAADRMYERGIRHLPVLEGESLVGLVSERDLALISTFSKQDLQLQNLWKEGVSVRDVMTTHPIVLAPLDSVEQAIEIAIHEKIGAFPVVDGGHLVGLVTVVDLLRVGLRALQRTHALG